MTQPTGVSKPEPIESMDALRSRDRKQDIALKRRYANSALIGVGVQMLITDGVFIAYARGVQWKVEAAVMQGWLAATVIQVIGVVLVITKYLFPPRQGD